MKIEPLVQANHKKLVHHILIYTCHAGLDPYLDTSWDCFDSPNSIPLSIQACILSAEIAGWAIGGLVSGERNSLIDQVYVYNGCCTIRVFSFPPKLGSL